MTPYLPGEHILNYIVRRADSEDYKHGLLETLSSLSDVGDLDSEAWRALLRSIHAQDGHIFVAELKGQVIGTTTILIEQKLIHGGGLVGHIEDVATRKGYEGKGVGRSVVSAAMAYAHERGCYKIILDCSEENVPFYEKLGFARHEVGMRLPPKR